MTNHHLLRQCQHCHFWPAKYIIEDRLICPNCVAKSEIYRYWDPVRPPVSEPDYFVSEYDDEENES